MFYDKAICCFKKEFFFFGPYFYCFRSSRHLSFHSRSKNFHDFFPLLVTDTTDNLRRSAETRNFPITKRCNGSSRSLCLLQGPPPPSLPLSLSAHGKIHSTADSSVFAVFITSYARVTARMRLLVHFTTTTYAWYECWAPGILHSPSLLTFLSTTSPRVFPSFTSFVCCHAPFWWSAEARVNGRTYEEL